MKSSICRFAPVLFFCLLLAGTLPAAALAGPAPAPGAQERCPVCGMFVSKHTAWIAQIRLLDGGTLYFDGVKDLMVCSLDPASCGIADATRIGEVWVQDYYTLKWIDGRRASYVIGSDVYGPMGHEFIPFVSREAAEAFRADHQGEKIVEFGTIDKALVESMRAGGRMR